MTETELNGIEIFLIWEEMYLPNLDFLRQKYPELGLFFDRHERLHAQANQLMQLAKTNFDMVHPKSGRTIPTKDHT